MIFNMIGKIVAVSLVELVSKQTGQLKLTEMKILDEVCKTVETVQLPATQYEKLKANEGKYILLPFSFIQFKGQALISVSEQHPFVIHDNSILGYIGK